MTLGTTNDLPNGVGEAANEKPYEATMRQAFGLWITPEIEHRRQTGRLPDGFSLYAAQVIMDMDTDARRKRAGMSLITFWHDDCSLVPLAAEVAKASRQG